jgi:hypothetical protein
MVWFKVDDTLATHAKVVRAGNAATNEDGPGRCVNTVIPGPRRPSEEID